MNWTLVCSSVCKWFSRGNEREKIEKWFERRKYSRHSEWPSCESQPSWSESVFVVCKAYLTLDNKFKVWCLVEVTQDYFSSLIWSSRLSLPQFSPCLTFSPLLMVICSHLDQRQTQKIKQINSDASDNIPLWLTWPPDLWDTLAGVVTPIVALALSITRASVYWVGLRVLTCRKIQLCRNDHPVHVRQRYPDVQNTRRKRKIIFCKTKKPQKLKTWSFCFFVFLHRFILC